MEYFCTYESIIGKLILKADDNYLLNIYFDNDYKNYKINTNNVLNKTIKWLDNYFNKNNNEINEIPIKLIGTDFSKRVWEITEKIPYGETCTYKDIALKLIEGYPNKKMSAQAVGNALNKNPIPIIIPCHRVIGKNGNLVGYGGGINKKEILLELERGKNKC